MIYLSLLEILKGRRRLLQTFVGQCSSSTSFSCYKAKNGKEYKKIPLAVTLPLPKPSNPFPCPKTSILNCEVLPRESRRWRNHLSVISISPNPHQAHHPSAVPLSFHFSHSAPLPDQSESEDDLLSLQSGSLRSSKDEVIVTRDYFIFLLEHVNGRDISKYLTSKHCRFHHYPADSTVSLPIPDPTTRIADSLHPSKRQIAVLRDLYTQRLIEKLKHNPKHNRNQPINTSDPDCVSPPRGSLQASAQYSSRPLAPVSLMVSPVSTFSPVRVEKPALASYPTPEELAELFNQQPIPIPQKQPAERTQTTQTTQTTTSSSSSSLRSSPFSSVGSQSLVQSSTQQTQQEEKSEVWSPSLDKMLLQLGGMHCQNWDFIAASTLGKGVSFSVGVENPRAGETEIRAINGREKRRE